MEHSNDITPENMRGHDLVDRFLVSRRILKSSAAETSAHLDDESLATFVEGTISRREMEPLVSHLVDCSFCLHKTAELLRLDFELADAGEFARITDTAQPSKISAVLSDLFSKIFGTNDGAVFAHHEKDEAKDADEEKKPGSES